MPVSGNLFRKRLARGFHQTGFSPRLNVVRKVPEKKADAKRQMNEGRIAGKIVRRPDEVRGFYIRIGFDDREKPKTGGSLAVVLVLLPLPTRNDFGFTVSYTDL